MSDPKKKKKTERKLQEMENFAKSAGLAHSDVLGSYTGTHPIEYYISRAVPTTDDFLIGEIEARDYTGEPIVVEPPELAPPKTGMGEVTIRYDGETTDYVW